MKKRTKLIAVLSAAALLAGGVSMTSFAASGWQEDNGTWVYLDNDGNRITDTWKKSGNQYFYLDESGNMAVNTLVEYDGEKYFVDSNGAKITDKWINIPNDDQWDENVDTIYYRLGSTGKAYAADKKTIDGKIYIFDDEGHMLSGWQTYGDDNDLYYLGTENEGWAYTGWHYLEPDEDISGDYNDEEWFYFSPSSGKAYKNARKYINGYYYVFDENGVMHDKWVTGTPGAPDYTSRFGAASDSSSRYQEDVGNQQTSWVYVYAPDDVDEDGDKYWYYLDSKGVPFNQQAVDSYGSEMEGYSIAVKRDGDKWLDNSEDIKKNVAARVIKSKTYLFDEDGKMLTGVYYLRGVKRTGSSSDLGAVMGDGDEIQGAFYYFNKNEGSTQGQMMTGKQTINYDGDNYYYYFQKNGQAYTNIIADGALYGADGARINAEDGNTYQLIDIPAVDDDDNPYWIGEKGNNNKHSDCMMIVNASGKVKKSGTVKIDGYKYTVKDYEVVGAEPVD